MIKHLSISEFVEKDNKKNKSIIEEAMSKVKEEID